MQLKISEFLLYLLQHKSFYGRLATSMLRVPRPGLKSLAIGIHNGRFALYFDPEYIEAIGMDAAMYMLEHEMLHAVLDHIPRHIELLSHMAPDDRMRARAVMGVAADCAIGSLMRKHAHRTAASAFQRKWVLDHLEPGESMDVVEGMTEGMHMPEAYGLPDGRTFEFYLVELMKRVELIPIPLTDHSMWSSEGGEGKEGADSLESLIGSAHRLRDQIKPMLQAALDAVGGFGRGLLPGEVEEFLRSYLAEPVVPWWEVFHSRAKASKLAKTRRTTSVPNRTLLALSQLDPSIIASPGRTRDRSWKVVFCKDTSGSVPSDELKIALNEMHHMLRVDEAMEVRSIDFDAAVHRDEVLKPGDKIPFNVMGRGGTDFDAPFEYLKRYLGNEETEPDIVVVFTDGWAPPVKWENRLPPHIPVIWLVTPQHSAQFDGYGEVIVCDPKHKATYAEPEVFTDN